MQFAGRSNGTATAVIGVRLAVPLRASPTLGFSGTAKVFEHDNAETSTTTPAVSVWRANNPMMRMTQAGYSGLTDDRVISWYIIRSGYFDLDAEP